MNPIHGVRTLFTNPTITREYLFYLTSKLLNSGDAVLALPYGVKITALSGFSEYHSCAHFLDEDELKFLLNRAITSGEVIDVGANLGVISLLMAKRYPDRRVHAFEPNPSTFQALEKNVKLNSCQNIQPVHYAVADQSGWIQFSADSTNRGTCSISSSVNNGTIEVPCTTLDDYCERNSIEKVAFLKVDVEGYEALVLKGAERILNKHKVDLIYYEVCPEHTVKAGFDPLLPTTILKQSGYKIYKLDERSELKSVNESDIDRVTSENWIAALS